MDENTPPPLISSSRVLFYAIVDSTVRFTPRNVLYVDGVELGAVPRLAVGKNLIDEDVFLLHCDAGWNSLGTSGSGDIDNVMAEANRRYDGLATKWIKSPYGELDVAKSIVDLYVDQRCSFCGRYHIELGASSMIEGKNAAICGECIERFHAVLINSNPDQSDAPNHET